MRRGSLVIAALALVLSMLIHLFGLGLTFRVGGPDGPPDSAGDAVPVGTTFEELAEDAAEPVEPEPAEEPEPPVETSPEPEEADIPTSQAQVASSDPQQVESPDIGSATEVSPEPAEPVEPTTDSVDEVGTQQGTGAEEEVTPPLEAEPVAEAPVAPPVERLVETEDVSPDPSESAEPEQLAAVKPQAAQEPIEQSTVPVVPVETDPVIPESAEQVEPEETEKPDTGVGSALAVTSSIRPRPPSRQSKPIDTTPDSLFNSARNFDSLRFPEQAIESPLTTYRRKGVDAFADANVGAQPGARGGGNSDTTNYAGRVLVHLNNAPTTHVPGRGHAQVYFEINPDGSLGRVNIVDSSGSIKIDNAAKAQVRAAAPFPKPPSGKSRTMSFYYRIN
ncbi:TonB family protein [Tropicibacter sp. Alg240-R139]|uniref:TonB family protein n=1 Tax=Tropicibacter sp. Alg240-R139 TaxID=2305991 RepID=UPI001F079DCB|nr:TonB family protein [Tropicibacter sp. Alg240-R139]